MISIKVSLCVGLILLPLLLTAADSNEIEIIANGGIVKWIDKNSLSYKTNQVTGGLELDSQGNPAIIYHTYASFTGTSTFQFPNDSNITFLSEST
jgi:hypothetical protein